MLLVNNLKKSDEKCIVCIVGIVNEYVLISILVWINKIEYEILIIWEIFEIID